MATTELDIFSRLPVEVLGVIFRQLGLDDLKALRSTSKTYFRRFNPEFLHRVLGDDLFYDLLASVCINCWSPHQLVWRETRNKVSRTKRLHDNEGYTTCYPCAVSDRDIVFDRHYCIVYMGEVRIRETCIWCMCIHAPGQDMECQEKYRRARICCLAAQILRPCISTVAYALGLVYLPGDNRVIVPAAFAFVLIFARAWKLVLRRVVLYADIRSSVAPTFFSELFNSVLVAIPMSSILSRPPGEWNRGMAVALAFLCAHLAGSVAVLAGYTIIGLGYDLRRAHRKNASWVRWLTSLVAGPLIVWTWAEALKTEPMGCGDDPPGHAQKLFFQDIFMFPKRFLWRFIELPFKCYLFIILEQLCMGITIKD